MMQALKLFKGFVETGFGSDVIIVCPSVIWFYVFMVLQVSELILCPTCLELRDKETQETFTFISPKARDHLNCHIDIMFMSRIPTFYY